MKQLCIDTSSNICSVAVLENTRLIRELNITDSKTHSENLMPLIKKLFDETKLSLENIDYVSCSIGPRFFYWT